MKKAVLTKAVTLILALSMLLSTTACSEQPATTTAAASTTPASKVEKINVILATTAIQDAVNFKPVNIFMSEVDKQLPGRINWQVFYNSTLGGEKEVMNGMLTGNIQACLLSDAAINMAAEKWPGAEIGNVPFLIPSLEAYYYLLDNYLGSVIEKEYLDRGFHSLFYICASGVEIGNTKKPIKTPEDMKGMKIRAWSAEGPYKLLETFGAIPTVLALSEVYTALSQKTVDGVITSDFQFVNQNFCEVTKYLTKAGMLHNYFPMVVEEKWYQSLPQDVKDAFNKAAKTAHTYARDVNAPAAEADTFGKLKEKGVEVDEWDDATKQAAQDQLKDVYSHFRDAIGADLFDNVVKTLDEYKAKHK